MLRNRHERGEGQMGCLVGLVLLLIAGLVAYKMIPIKVKAAELRGTVVDYAKSAGQHNDAQIKRAILQKAENLGLPVGERDIEISRRAGTIRVRAKYVVPVEFPGYTYNWQFEHYAENPIF